MAVLDINWRPSARHLRQFSVLQLGFFALLAAWLHHRDNSSPFIAVMLGISSVACLVGLAFPSLLRPVYVTWMALAFPIGWVVSHLLLAGVYYLLVTPVGMIMKLSGYDPMHRKLDRQKDSYWQPRDELEDTRRYFKQY